MLLLLACNIAGQQKASGNSIASCAQEVSATEAQESSQSALLLPLTDPYIVVLKSQRRLQLHSAGKLVRT